MNHDAESPFTLKKLVSYIANRPIPYINPMSNTNNEQAETINAADTLAKKALDYEDPTKAVRYGDVVEAAREYWRVRGE